MTQLRKGADAAETALAGLVQQRQADETAFKEQMASPDGELTGDAYDAMLAGHLAQRQSHAIDRATLEAMSESARRKAALGEQLFAAEQAPASYHPYSLVESSSSPPSRCPLVITPIV